MNYTEKCFTRALTLVLGLGLLAVPARCGVIYNNDFGGVISGDHYSEDSFDVGTDSGYQVSNSFSLAFSSSVTGFSVALWLIPGDTFVDLSWAITSAPLGGTTLASATTVTPASSSLLVSNNGVGFGGYEVDEETFSIAPALTLAAGTTYYLQLDGADVDYQGAAILDPVGWDQSDGPSLAYGSGYSPELLSDPSNNLPCNGLCTDSESFELIGSATPEPASGLLIGTGLLTVAFAKRKRLLQHCRSVRTKY